jgi:hypothetical protein
MFPVILVTPAPVITTPGALVPVPPITFPVMFKVPTPPFETAPPSPVPPVIEPTILAEPAAPKETVALPPGEPDILAVKVIPALREKLPPEVAPLAVSLLNSSTVVSTLIVTVKLFAMSVSAEVNDENRLLAAPLGVVAQIAPFMFPVALA